MSNFKLKLQDGAGAGAGAVAGAGRCSRRILMLREECYWGMGKGERGERGSGQGGLKHKGKGEWQAKTRA